jgi:hypothetical protein
MQISGFGNNTFASQDQTHILDVLSFLLYLKLYAKIIHNNPFIFVKIDVI